MTGPRPAPKRRRWGWRRIHKWIGVSGGVLLLIWIVTGIFISWPAGGRAVLQAEPPKANFARVDRSPADVVATVASQGVAPEDVESVELRQLGSRATYVVRTARSGFRLVDAITGVPFEVDAAEAGRIAAEAYAGPGRAADAELVTTRSLRYFVGELPVYRIEFDDRYNTEIYVTVATGLVQWWDAKSRTRRWMAALHDLWPVGPALGRLPRIVAMVGGGVLCLLITVTGYWLAWRRGGWRWRKRRPGPGKTKGVETSVKREAPV